MSPETLTFEADGTPVDGGRFTVETNGEWQAEVDSKLSWPRLSATAGTGSGMITARSPSTPTEP